MCGSVLQAPLAKQMGGPCALLGCNSLHTPPPTDVMQQRVRCDAKKVNKRSSSGRGFR